MLIDTQGFFATTPTATKAATVVTGDSFTLKNFGSPATAHLVGIFREHATQGFVKIVSPRFANTTTGIKLRALDSPAAYLHPPYALQSLYSGDTWVVSVSGGKTTASPKHLVGAYQVFYSTVGGAAARLHNWADIEGNIQNLFTQTVTVAKGAYTKWHTQLTNHTSDQMKADATYALLGYLVDAKLGIVALKAQETGNSRIGGPGTTRSEVTSNYFVTKSNNTGLPFIPVVNANNRGNINVSVLSTAATVAAKVTLIWAQLTAPVTP